VNQIDNRQLEIGNDFTLPPLRSNDLFGIGHSVVSQVDEPSLRKNQTAAATNRALPTLITKTSGTMNQVSSENPPFGVRL